jgi:hypothetical protein
VPAADVARSLGARAWPSLLRLPDTASSLFRSNVRTRTPRRAGLTQARQRQRPARCARQQERLGRANLKPNPARKPIPHRQRVFARAMCRAGIRGCDAMKLRRRSATRPPTDTPPHPAAVRTTWRCIERVGLHPVRKTRFGREGGWQGTCQKCEGRGMAGSGNAGAKRLQQRLLLSVCHVVNEGSFHGRIRRTVLTVTLIYHTLYSW